MTIYDVRDERLAAAARVNAALLGYSSALEAEAEHAVSRKRALIDSACRWEEVDPAKVRCLLGQLRREERLRMDAERRKARAAELTRILG